MRGDLTIGANHDECGIAVDLKSLLHPKVTSENHRIREGVLLQVRFNHSAVLSYINRQHDEAFVFELGFDTLYGRCAFSTRPAPRRPEIQQYVFSLQRLAAVGLAIEIFDFESRRESSSQVDAHS